jgi:CRISPR type III-associated protein (TIGR04423 family)
METTLKIADKITIDTSLRYEGYLWLSDSKEPIVFDGKSPMNKNKKFAEINPFPSLNPFVIEGFLFLCANKESYSIKYVDGKYLVNRFIVTNDEKENSKAYLAHRMPEVDKLKFSQRWKSVKDEYCEGMEVLQPAEWIFTGLELKK